MSDQKSLKVVIADDEKRSIQLIEQIIIESDFQIEIVGKATTVLDAIKVINSTQPDLVLLDIEFTNGTGFDVVEGTSALDYHLIFITAYDQYAVKAFKCCATDYILKPIDVEDFENSIKKVIDKNASSSNQDLDFLMKTIDNPNHKKLALRMFDKVQIVELADICMIKADRSYSTFSMIDGSKYTVSNHLKYYEEILPSTFFRPYQSAIINLQQIKEISHKDGGIVVMKNDMQLEIPKSKKKLLIDRLNNELVI